VIAARGGTIVFVGREERLSSTIALDRDATVFDAGGGAVVPGFVDPHTHVVFAGDRRDELRRRLAGATYAEIAAAGGGILKTVAATRAASMDALVAETRPRLDEMLRCGTTTCEVKSGYGLTTDPELTMLRATASLARDQPIELAATFLVHQLPPEYRDRRDDYLRLVTTGTIPAVASGQLAEWCDVFCEEGAFTPAESRAVLTTAREHGLKLRIHADELGTSGGWRVAAELGVRSADHLVFVGAEGAAALAAAGVVATLAPAAAFYLKLGRFAPGRLLMEAGVAVALASDLNPGGGFSPSMPFAMTLACFEMGFTFEQALVASTINAAYSLDRHDRIGSLEVGRQLDAVVVDGPAVDLIRTGGQTIRAVIKKGTVVHARG
jgi:imidazolonepropionase